MTKTKLILEFSEFNAQRLNSDAAQMGVNVPNPQLSTDAFDKHEDAIRAGMAKINDILNNLSTTSQFKSLKSKLALENQQLSNLKVLRIVNRDEVNFDFYISFIIGDKEYFGTIRNITSLNSEFTSEVFKDTDLIQSKEWVIRTKGLIIKTLKKWLRPDEGNYELMADQILCNSSDTGNRVEIKKGEKVEVITTFQNKIIIKYKNDYFSLTNHNFIYFNYWFTRID